MIIPEDKRAEWQKVQRDLADAKTRARAFLRSLYDIGNQDVRNFLRKELLKTVMEQRYGDGQEKENETSRIWDLSDWELVDEAGESGLFGDE